MALKKYIIKSAMKQRINLKTLLAQVNQIKSSVIISYLKIFVIFLLAIYLLTNIFFSQLISPVYFRLVDNDKSSAILFLKRIQPFSFFEREYNKYREFYGNSIYFDVFSEENGRNQKIKEFEQILSKNPKSRDVLYGLYLLYKEKGDNKTAEGYLKQAKAIDPSIRLF